MTFDVHAQSLIRSLFGGPWQPPRFRAQPPRFRAQPDHDRPVLITRTIVQPLTLVRCPQHSNPSFAQLVGLIGRDEHGDVVAEEIRHVYVSRQ